MSARDLPKTGKLVVASPDDAARIAANAQDAGAPELADRVFTCTELPTGKVLVFDLDAIYANADCPWRLG